VFEFVGTRLFQVNTVFIVNPALRVADGNYCGPSLGKKYGNRRTNIAESLDS
jgi:hypothetical protein